MTRLAKIRVGQARMIEEENVPDVLFAARSFLEADLNFQPNSGCMYLLAPVFSLINSGTWNFS